MKVAIVADAHLISPDDPTEGRRSVRQAFVEAAPSFRRVIDRLNADPVDRVIFTGDLVDYFSPENRDFALEIVEHLDVPWHLVPGNHDYQFVSEADGEVSIESDRDRGRRGWADAGVRLDNRVLDLDGIRFVLLDSALSDVPDGAKDWLTGALDTDRYCVLCTHVPVDHPAVVDAITDREPDRNLDKYVQRGAPTLYEDYLDGRVDAIFSGHLHFAAEATIGRTRQHILPLSIRRDEPRYAREGEVVILDTATPTSLRRIQPAATAQ